MKMRVRFAWLDPTLNRDQGIVEVNWVVEALSAAVVVDYAYAFSNRSGLQLFILDHQRDYVSWQFSSARVNRINLQRAVERRLNADFDRRWRVRWSIL